MDTPIQVNFNRPLPLFPISRMVLLPHAIQQLHIFEERYRQMVEHCLDAAGQIAMATFALDQAEDSPQDLAELRPAVCIGQIMQHHRLPDGRFNLLLLGICRARIVAIDEPEDERMFRIAQLELADQVDEQGELSEVRDELRRMLAGPRLNTVRGLSRVIPLFARDDVSTPALLELVGNTLVDDHELRYLLLAEPSPQSRAALIQRELRTMDALIRSAEPQMETDWPKGMSWN